MYWVRGSCLVPQAYRGIIWYFSVVRFAVCIKHVDFITGLELVGLFAWIVLDYDTVGGKR